MSQGLDEQGKSSVDALSSADSSDLSGYSTKEFAIVLRLLPEKGNEHSNQHSWKEKAG